MRNETLINIIKQVREETNNIDDIIKEFNIPNNEPDTDLKMLFDFEEEIKALEITQFNYKNNDNLINCLTAGMTCISIIIFIYISEILNLNGIWVIISSLISLIFWYLIFIFLFEIPENTYKYYENEEKYVYSRDTFYVFDKVYYPKGYKKEFGTVFLQYYEKYKDKFSEWVINKEITNRQLYSKLLKNKSLQYDILKEIKKSKDFRIAEYEKEKKQKEEQERKRLEKHNNMQQEMNKFFDDIETNI